MQSILKQFNNDAFTSTELRLWAVQKRIRVSRWSWVSQILISMATALSIGLFVYELYAIATNFNVWQYVTIPIPRRSLLPLLLPLITALIASAYVVPYQQARLMARQLIARDKSRKDSWELLVLTGIDAQAYIRGKWWTILRLVAPKLIPSAIIRAGMMAFIVGEASRVIALSELSLYGAGTIKTPTLLDMLLLVGLSMLLTFSGLPIAVAGSLDDALELPRHGGNMLRWTLRRAVGFLELATMALVVLGVMSALFVLTQNGVVLLFAGLLIWTVFDNGFVLSALLATNLYLFANLTTTRNLLPGTPEILLLVLLALPLMALRVAFRLYMARRTAQRYGLVKNAASR
ncbi:MAG: hypothetical protein U0694_22895 [Anaerolineae bacterium]